MYVRTYVCTLCNVCDFCLFLSVSFYFYVFSFFFSHTPMVCCFLPWVFRLPTIFACLDMALGVCIASRKQVAFVQSVDWWHLITRASLFLVILMMLLLLLLFWLLLQHYNVLHHVLPCFLVACWCLHDLFMHRYFFLVGHTNSLTDSLWRVMQTTLFRGRKAALPQQRKRCMYENVVAVLVN